MQNYQVGAIDTAGEKNGTLTPGSAGAQQLFSFAEAWEKRRSDFYAQEAGSDPEFAARFRAEMLEQTTLSAIATDLDGFVLYANRAAADFYGWRSEEDLRGRSAAELVQPRMTEEGLAEIRQVLRQGRTWNGEYNVCPPTGGVIPALVTISPLRNSKEELIGALIISTDISERKQFENRIKKLSSAIEQTADAIVIMDRDWRIEYVNAAWERLTGYSAREVVGQGADLLNSGAQTEEFCARLRRTLLSGETFNAEFTNRRKNGAMLIEDKTITPIRDDRGEVTHYVSVSRDIGEKKAQEAALQASEARYRLLFESNPQPMFVFDLETLQFLAVNAAAVAHYGYSDEEFLGMNLADIRPDEDVERLRNHFSSSAARVYYCGLWRHRTKNGKLIWVEVSSHPIDFGGRPAKLCIAVDVTARVANEAMLRESEERFRQLAENIQKVFWMVDPEAKKVLYISPAYEKVWGRSFEDQGEYVQQWLNAVYPEDLERVLERMRDLRTGNSEIFYRIIRGDGKVRWIRDRGFPVRNPDGVVYRVVGTAEDVTEKKEAEAQMAQHAALLDHAREAIIVKDLEDRIIFWNKGSERLYEWSAEEAIGQKAGTLLHKNSSSYLEARHALLEKGEWSGEITPRTKSGRVLNVEGSWTLVRDEQGSPKSILEIGLDITDKKRLEAQYLRAQRLESIGTLAGGIAHDLNNVLAPIIMSFELLNDYVTDDSGRALLATLTSSAQRGADLVKQVLSFARGMEGQRVMVNLYHIAREIQKIARETFPKNIEFSLISGRDLWTVTGDPTQLHQVLMNLCVNARDAMPMGGKIEVRIENAELDEVYCGLNPEAKAGPYIVMTVADNGAGIAPEIRDKIFDPFFTTKEPGRGTGLGLATVDALVKAHGGFLNLYSEIGKGTRFKICLPASRAVSEVSKEAEADLPRGRGECVLLVDDEEAVRNVGQKTLERFGYEVVLASNGAEAVSRYVQERDRVCVVITDIAMPVMDGVATIAALRTINPAVRIVASSGLTVNAELTKALGAGIEHFVPKPYTAPTLLRTLRAALGPSR